MHENMRKVLPEVLKNADASLIEKYVTLLHFIVRGVAQGKKRIKSAEEAVSKATTASARAKASKELETAKNVFDSRFRLKYDDGSDPLLDHLKALGLVRFLSRNDSKSRSVGYVLIEDPEDCRHHAILEAYRGIFPPLIRHDVTADPVHLLEQVITDGSRPEKILRPHDAESTPQWAFNVPRYFNDALDIKLMTRKWNTVDYTAWTQGSNFAFKQGDVIFRVGNEREPLQIKAAAGSGRAEEESVSSNDPGFVTFMDFQDKKEKTMTQHNFVRMLIGKTSKVK